VAEKPVEVAIICDGRCGSLPTALDLVKTTPLDRSMFPRESQ